MHLLVFSDCCRRSTQRTLADGGLASSLSYVKGAGVCTLRVGFDEQDFNRTLKTYVKNNFLLGGGGRSLSEGSIQKAETGRFL